MKTLRALLATALLTVSLAVVVGPSHHASAAGGGTRATVVGPLAGGGTRGD